MNTTSYTVGQNLSVDEVKTLTSGKVAPGWYDASNGQRVYICDGSHRDGHRGYKVLALGGLN